MTRTPLYKYKGNNGEIITTVDLGIEHEEMVRLVADAGKYITDGKVKTSVIDVFPHEVELWTEQEYKEGENAIVFDDLGENEEGEK